MKHVGDNIRAADGTPLRIIRIDGDAITAEADPPIAGRGLFTLSVRALEAEALAAQADTESKVHRLKDEPSVIEEKRIIEAIKAIKEKK